MCKYFNIFNIVQYIVAGKGNYLAIPPIMFNDTPIMFNDMENKSHPYYV